MKSKIKTVITIVLVLMGILLLESCEKNNFTEFALVKEGHEKANFGPITIVSYSLTINPTANGVASINLSDGSIYKATQLNPSQVSSLLSILNSDNITFDKTNNEFSILKSLP